MCVPVALNICSHNLFASSALNLICLCKSFILTVPKWLVRDSCHCGSKGVYARANFVLLLM